MATLASLAIELTANSAKMVQELQKANNKLTGFEKTAKAVGTAVKGALVAATTGVFAGMVNESLKAGAELTKLARIANTSTSDFQMLAAETKKIGIEQEKLADILKDTNDKIGDFISTGGGAAVDFFENIAPLVGVTADQFKNLSGAQALELYVQSLNKANLSQQEMTFYMEAIASDATALIPIFSRTSEQAKRLSVILTDVELENMRKAKESIDDATTAIDLMGNKLVASLAPAIESASEKLIEFFSAMANEGNSVGVLEQRIAELNAALASVGSGRNAPSLRRGITQQLEELNNQLQAAQALTGDLDAVEAQRIKTSEKLLELKTQLEEVDGAGRSAIGRANAIRTEIAALEDYQMKLIEVAETKATVDPVKDEKTADIAGAQAALDALFEGPKADELFGLSDPLARILGSDPDATIERLQQHLMTENEAIENGFIQRQELAWAARERDLISQQEYEKISLRNTEKYNKDQAKLCKIKNKAIMSCDEQRMRATLSATAAFFGVMASQNKKFAIGQALINTYLGVSESLAAYPMPLAAIMAATHLAAGMQQVNAIKSGGSGGGSVSSSVSTASVSGSDSFSEFTQSTEFSRETEQRTLDVNLNIDDEALLSKNQLRQVMEQINEAAENARVRINV